MKNHTIVDGRLLQTNKKWSNLKEKQKEWIAQITKVEYVRYIVKHKEQPSKNGKAEIIGIVYDKINQRSIWIPFYEAEAHIGKHIDRHNRKEHDVVGENGEVITVKIVSEPKKTGTAKPKPPKISFNELPDETKESFSDKIRTVIALYINHAAKIPPNKVRDSQLKMILGGFNVKQYKKVGAKVVSDETLLSVFDNISNELFTDYKTNGRLNVETKKEKLNKSLIVLESDRLILRKMHMGDANEISLIISDIEVMYAWERAFTTQKETRDWIIKQLRRYKHEQVGYFLAVDKPSGEVVGQIGLMWNEINGEKLLEVGYILKKTYWHKGYATEGARACLEYGFDVFDIDKITASIRPENAASISVADRLGMKLTGEYEKEFDERVMKHLIYSINKEDAV